MSDPAANDPASRARRVKLMIFDVDGVMTDGRLQFTSSGEELKSFHVLDGHGVKMLQSSGVQPAILTARRSSIVERRANELGINLLRQGATDKLAGLNELLGTCAIGAEHTGYIGDDIMDLPVLLHCGFAATVPDAPALVRERVHLVTRTRGGYGAVREVCEFIMRAQGTLEKTLAPYLA